jgi:hypothetical protein
MGGATSRAGAGDGVGSAGTEVVAAVVDLRTFAFVQLNEFVFFGQL